MIYHVVAFSRSGSSHLNLYCKNHNMTVDKNVITLGEFFQRQHYIDNEKISYDRSGHANGRDETNKINFLKKYPNKYSFKFIPHTVPEEFRSDILEYLNNCNLLTIKRDPFDMFLSHTYQKKTGWKQSHGATEPLLNKLEINIKDIKYFIKIWNENKNFIDSCKIYHTFNYNNLDEQLYDFFGVRHGSYEIDPMRRHWSWSKIKPMQIDYRSLLVDYELIEERFYEEIQPWLLG